MSLLYIFGNFHGNFHFHRKIGLSVDASRVCIRDSGMQSRKIEDTMLPSSPTLSRTLLHKISYYTIRSSSRAYPSVFCTTCSAGVSRVSTSFAQKWTLPLLRLHPCVWYENNGRNEKTRKHVPVSHGSGGRFSQTEVDTEGGETEGWGIELNLAPPRLGLLTLVSSYKSQMGARRFLRGAVFLGGKNQNS